LRFEHMDTGPTDAPGIVLRIRELHENGPEGHARENGLGRTREGILPTARGNRRNHMSPDSSSVSLSRSHWTPLMVLD